MMSPKLHWIDRILEDLKKRGDETLTFSTGKTPSGPIHIGVGREFTYCSVLHHTLQEEGYRTRFLFFVDDFDSLKNYPPSTPAEFKSQTQYIGRPLFLVPCPHGDCESWAHHYARELIEAFPSFGFDAEIQWSHVVYEERGMKDLIRTALKHTATLRSILLDIIGPTFSEPQLQAFQREMDNWYPCLVVCEECSRLQTSPVVAYHMEDDRVDYRCGGCGHVGNVKIATARVKLRWRIDWPAKWALFKVSCEPAGKDHCVKGGAYDTGEAISQQVFGWKGPYRIPYEWVLLQGKAMKTHRGISFAFKEWLTVAPPETYRYLVLREDPRKGIRFSPDRIPQLIDEFERAEQIYYQRQKASSDDEAVNVNRIYPLCLLKSTPPHAPSRLPYRFAIILTQLQPLLGEDHIRRKTVEVTKRLYSKDSLTEDELAMIDMRLRQGGMWVKNYAPEDMRFVVTESLIDSVKNTLTSKDIEALQALRQLLEANDWGEEELQYAVFELGKKLGLGTRIFQAVYLIFVGRSFGPRLAPFLLSMPREFVLKRLDACVAKG